MLSFSSPLWNSMMSGGGRSGTGGGGTEGNSSSSSEDSFLMGKLGDASPEVVDMNEEAFMFGFSLSFLALLDNLLAALSLLEITGGLF